MKKHILLSIFVATVLVSTTGCQSLFEPEVFGVPQSQWNTLTPAQRQEVIRGYNERKRIEAQVEPLNRAADMMGDYLESKKKPRVKQVVVPVIKNSYSSTTLMSPPSRSVIKETKVVNINKKVVNINRDSSFKRKRRAKMSTNFMSPKKENIIPKRKKQPKMSASEEGLFASSESDLLKKKKRAEVSPIRENPFASPTSDWEDGKDKIVTKRGYGSTTTR